MSHDHVVDMGDKEFGQGSSHPQPHTGVGELTMRPPEPGGSDTQYVQHLKKWNWRNVPYGQSNFPRGVDPLSQYSMSHPNYSAHLGANVYQSGIGGPVNLTSQFDPTGMQHNPLLQHGFLNAHASLGGPVHASTSGPSTLQDPWAYSSSFYNPVVSDLSSKHMPPNVASTSSQEKYTHPPQLPNLCERKEQMIVEPTAISESSAISESTQMIVESTAISKTTVISETRNNSEERRIVDESGQSGGEVSMFVEMKYSIGEETRAVVGKEGERVESTGVMSPVENKENPGNNVEPGQNVEKPPESGESEGKERRDSEPSERKETEEMIKEPMDCNMDEETDVESNQEDEVEGVVDDGEGMMGKSDESEEEEEDDDDDDDEEDDDSEDESEEEEMGKKKRKYTMSNQSRGRKGKAVSSNPATCVVCRQKFGKEAAMRTHLSEHLYYDIERSKILVYDTKQGMGKVGKASPFSNSMVNSSDFTFTCGLCNVMFMRKKQLLAHRNTTHKSQQCEYEGKILVQRTKPAVRTPREYKPAACPICGVVFKRGDRLKHHLLLHAKENLYQCDVCHLNLANPGALKKHRLLHVKDEVGSTPGPTELFVCEVCGKSTKSKRQLRFHMTVHTGEKIFNCNVCGMEFSTSARLTKHKKEHQFNKQFICDVCGSAYTRSQDLKTHYYRVHFKKRAEEAEGFMGTNKYKRKDKRFPCDTCSKVFKTKEMLQYHGRVHTGEKPYICDICNKSFRYPTSLTSHKKIHSGEKPFECDVCHQRFRRKDYLQGHYRIHTGEKPYACKVCGQRFRQQGDMLAHQKRHANQAKQVSNAAALPQEPTVTPQMGMLPFGMSQQLTTEPPSGFVEIKTMEENFPLGWGMQQDSGRYDHAQRDMSSGAKLTQPGVNLSSVRPLDGQPDPRFVQQLPAMDHQGLGRGPYAHHIPQSYHGPHSGYQAPLYHPLDSRKDRTDFTIPSSHHRPYSYPEPQFGQNTPSDVSTLEKLSSGQPCLQVPSTEASTLLDLSNETASNHLKPPIEGSSNSLNHSNASTSLQTFSAAPTSNLPTPIDSAPNVLTSDSSKPPSLHILSNEPTNFQSSSSDFKSPPDEPTVLEDSPNEPTAFEDSPNEPTAFEDTTDEPTTLEASSSAKELTTLEASSDNPETLQTPTQETPSLFWELIKDEVPPKPTKPRVSSTPALNHTKKDEARLLETLAKTFPQILALRPQKRGRKKLKIKVAQPKKKHMCYVCGRGVLKLTKYLKHVKKHIGEWPFKCGQCERGFPSQAELIAHAKTHSGRAKHRCTDCGDGFKQLPQLTLHGWIHKMSAQKPALKKSQKPVVGKNIQKSAPKIEEKPRKRGRPPKSAGTTSKRAVPVSKRVKAVPKKSYTVSKGTDAVVKRAYVVIKRIDASPDRATRSSMRAESTRKAESSSRRSESLSKRAVPARRSETPSRRAEVSSKRVEYSARRAELPSKRVKSSSRKAESSAKRADSVLKRMGAALTRATALSKKAAALSKKRAVQVQRGVGRPRGPTRVRPTPSKCPVCGEKVAKEAAMKSHISNHLYYDMQKGMILIRGESGLVGHREPTEQGEDQKQEENEAVPFTHSTVNSYDFNFTCSLCNVKFMQKRLLFAHRDAEHERTKCEYDGKALVLKPRPAVRTPRRYKPAVCEICGAIFKRGDRLKHHLILHDKKDMYQCDICHLNLANPFALKKHKLLHVKSEFGMDPSPEKDYVCEVCGKLMKSKRRLKLHMTVHTGEKIFHCTVCQMEFSTRARLNKHKSEHQFNRQFVCDLCGSAYTRSQDLKTHHYRVHVKKKAEEADGIRNPYGKPKRPKEVKTYPCETCSKIFRTKELLQYHANVHTGEKPYVCQVCNKSFRYPTSLASHKKIHSGEKPFECDICHQRFRRKDYLQGHYRIHTGEKPYACKVCGQRFRQQGDMQAHQKRHARQGKFIQL